MIDEKLLKDPLRKGSLRVEIVPAEEYFNRKGGFPPVHVNLSCLTGISLADPKNSKPPKCYVFDFSSTISGWSGNEEIGDRREAYSLLEEVKPLLIPGEFEKTEQAIKKFFG